ncbi:AMP-binding protein [Pontibacter ramchanderi]|uniref:Phenylacetate-CoA ligase n=1 Tax=Pontibacter ramchanderi TaxID=1179743 RepID=A0A2N3V0W5_9BACT|nr:AMP-binding protein [Pontibacter ramchanderi]PKV75270.1 phenylacetate-CoA ligase [Pontibacter ramchanderi]
MAENKKPAIGLNDEERFPLLSDLSFLQQLRQDAHAPRYNFRSGDRLESTHLEKVKQYAHTISHANTFWEAGEQPAWLEEYINWCIATVPFYENRPGSFAEQPTISRSDLRAAPWDFVSRDAVLDELLVYQTSGTTGPAMDVLFDPVSQACWIPQLQSVLQQHGISLDAAPDKVAIALICSQPETLTYASLSTYLNGAGVLKINLNPADWKSPEDRLLYLQKYNPQVLTGDPFAFLDLLKIQPAICPKVLVSSAMKLTAGVRQKLEDYFACPVLDIYSLTECRMVACADGDGDRYKVIRPELYLEVFHKDEDIPLPYGERGELVITGGNNPFLPLIRYRTGDFCSLEMENGIPHLVGLEARLPVPFYTLDGEQVKNIEVSRAMMQFPLAGFKLHQANDYRLTFTGWSDEAIAQKVQEELLRIFKSGIAVDIAIHPVTALKETKVVNYSSAFTL